MNVSRCLASAALALALAPVQGAQIPEKPAPREKTPTREKAPVREKATPAEKTPAREDVPPPAASEQLARKPGQSAGAFAAAASEWAGLNADQRARLTTIAEEYPEEIVGVERSAGRAVALKMRSGAVVVFDDLKVKSHAERLTASDVEDMLADGYPRSLADRWPANLDPGRYRSAPFFKAVYGESEKAVAANLTPVKFCGQTVRFNRRNGASAALEAVGSELEKLVSRQPELKKYVEALGGAFNWRNIANSEALSAHSFGIAIDLNPKLGGYWEWNKEDMGDMKRRKDYPAAIVETFERHGFVWGGKWYHFDLMHFEFRPEILRGQGHARRAETAGSNTTELAANGSTPAAAAGAPATPVPAPGPAVKTPDGTPPEPPPRPAAPTPADDTLNLLFNAAFKVSPYDTFSKVSKIGILRIVQARLAYEGWYTGPLNGEFDESTQHAIRDWQKEKGVAPNGLLDEATLNTLNLLNLTESRSKGPAHSPAPHRAK